MKALIVSLALLAAPGAATAAAQLPEGSPGRANVQFDGTDALVQIVCGKLDGECRGQVLVAAVDAPTAAVGGPVPYVVAAEDDERVRVPLSDAGKQLLGSARQVVVVVDAISAVKTVDVIPSESGIVPGQTEVSPAARQRSCRSFGRVFEVRVRGVECEDARSLITSVVKRGSRCAKRCVVKEYRCSRRSTRTTCTRDSFTVSWRRRSSTS